MQCHQPPRVDAMPEVRYRLAAAIGSCDRAVPVPYGGRDSARGAPIDGPEILLVRSMTLLTIPGVKIRREPKSTSDG
ncbi:hypothetical protein K227x_07290 [Rubripirellula lacrimiformis]|uniref:Uncharacterized protein n=1 Tax=Rubripirellula lacrimiformis TaxID=1930273 RepID=A0A517N5G2_9BACT|nr:hypothetical protein [Rubripirellula lacrimiformis]QDT02353.1 hypothetical protein K227x_07290 [Rubripirellula lacrimiformis]